MKKLTWAASKGIFGQVASSSCLVAVSAGVIFGVSAGTFKVEYLNLNDAQARLKAAVEHEYYSQNIISQWNMYQKKKPGEEGYIKGVAQPTSSDVTQEWWDEVHPGTTRLDKELHGINPVDFNLASETRATAAEQAARTKYSALIIDGSTHTAMDRSFNQGLYNGLANFNTNQKHDVTDNSEAQVYKPSQDSTQEFINIYRAVAAKSRVLALAGFNHVTPLNALGKQMATGLYEFADTNIANTGMMLMDGDVSNNQNIASVLFRSDEPAFLSALATGMYFYENLDQYHKNYEDIKVACYGGTAIPTVVIYMGGYQRGIEFFNYYVLKATILDKGARKYIMSGATNGETEEVLAQYLFVNKMLPYSKYKDEVETLHHAAEEEKTTAKVDAILEKLYEEYSLKMIKLGDFGTHFSGTFNSGDAIGISKQLLNRGANAIIAVAGPQSLDTAQEIMNQDSNSIVIGVDSAMERSDYQKPYKNPDYKDKTVDSQGKQSAQASNIIKFSAVKDMTNVSDQMLRLAASGKHWNYDNNKPWTSVAQMPEIEESAVLPESNKKSDVEGAFTIDTNEEDGTYDITGVNLGRTYGHNKHVYRIPLTITEEQADGTTKTYKLKNIGGLKIFAEGNSNTPTQLRWIDTLCFDGTRSTTQDIYFGTDAFDYTGWDVETQKDKIPGIKYVDLSNLALPKTHFGDTTFKNMIPTEEQGAENYSTYHAGLIRMNSFESDEDKKTSYERMFKTSIDDKQYWPIIEPDPYRSICSVGFKTCGNIENGLISISWDGWPLLFKSLCLLDFTDKPFFEKWIEWGHIYCEKYKEELPTEFQDLFRDHSNKVPVMEDFDTFDTNHTLCKNYSHVMAILGLVLKNCMVSFDQNMTVCIGTDGKPYLPTESVPMSILEWLKTNMYFTL